MKNTAKTLFLFITSLLVLPSCALLKSNKTDSRRDEIIQTGKYIVVGWGKEKILSIFPEADLDKNDTVYLKGNFLSEEVRNTITPPVADFFGPDGDFRFNMRSFMIDVDWTPVAGKDSVSRDSTTLIIIYYNKKNKKACLRPMKPLHEALQERLLTIVDESNQPIIKQIDRWNNQPSQPEQNIPLIMPAVFIDFGEVQWTAKKKLIQEGKLTIRIYVVQENYSDTQDSSVQQAQGLSNNYDLLEKIYTKLDGFSGGKFKPLVRTTTDFDSNYSNVLVDAITFSTTYTDTSKYEQVYSHTVKPDLEVTE